MFQLRLLFIFIIFALKNVTLTINHDDVMPYEDGENTPNDISDYYRSPDEDVEMGSKFEGDILNESNHTIALWSRVGKKIVIPFIIDEDSNYSPNEIYKIFTAMEEIEASTCVDFKWAESQEDYLFIYAGNLYNSYVGRIGGMQPVSVRGSSKGNIIHVLLHALGIEHMHTHSNRDKFIDVIAENIRDDARENFNKNEKNFSMNYDYFSIMHFGPFAFTKNGYATLMPKNSFYDKIIGQRNKLSPGDVRRIRKLYKCNCVEKGRKKCRIE